MLPEYFIVKAVENRYVVCTTQYVSRAWRTNVLNDSKEVIKGCVWMSDGISSQSENYIHERISSRCANSSFYESTMRRTKNYMCIPGLGKVCEYIMSSPRKILPTKYYRVCRNEDPDMKWHFTLAIESRNTIPVHVQKGFIELAIMKGETCPITLEKFEDGSVACTPCGHLFTKGVLDGMEICPTCRGKL